MSEELKPVPSIGHPVGEPDFFETLAELQGGILPEILTRSMAEVSRRVLSLGDAKSKGSLVIKMEFIKARGEDSLELAYQISKKSPTMRGDTSENIKDVSTVFVNRKGRVTVVPERQPDMFSSSDRG